MSVTREYARLAPDYDRRWSFYIEATVRETSSRLAVNPGEQVLDVGCGTGALLELLSASVPGAKLTGVDLSSAMLDVARRKLGNAVALEQGDATRLPFPGEAFDVVVSTSAFHFFRDPRAALAELGRVLRPGGRLVITDWCGDFLTSRLRDLWLRVVDRAHFRTYGSREFGRLLEMAGFRHVRIDCYRIDWQWGLMTAVGRWHGDGQAGAADRFPVDR